MTDENDDTFCAPGDFTHGGDVRSDPATIRALREGVHIERRTGTVGHAGAMVPVGVFYDAQGGSGVKLLTDVVSELERREEGPIRRTGTVELHSLEAITSYVRAHATSSAAGFLNARGARPRLEVVLDYHPANVGGAGARWCCSRAAYDLRLSRQWQLWTGNEGQAFTQTKWADFVEENAADFGHPTSEMPDAVPATAMVTMARNLAVYSKGTFERSVNATTGEGTLLVKDEHDVRSTKIPRGFMLALPVFDGSPEAYPVEAQLRFRMEEGRPVFSYLMKDRQRAYEHAIESVRLAVMVEAKIPVFAGEAPPTAKS